MRQPRLNLVVLIVNSSLGFALGAVVALQVYNLGLVVGGLLFDREPQWYPDRVEFAATGSEVAWLGGALLVLILGWALASIYRGGFRYDGTQLAVLWATLHCFREGLVALVRVPFVAESDTARALVALDLPEQLNWIVGVLGAAGLLGLGLLAAPALLRFARTTAELATKRARMTFIGAGAIAAWVFGSLLVLALLLPDSGSGALGLLPWSGAFLLFALVASPEPRNIDPVREPMRLAWGTLLLLAVLVAAAKVLLADGVGFLL
jgi:hypothetical protein